MSRKPRTKLTNSPLVLVLCQVRFAPIMAMAEYFPKVQDKLRLQGYPVSKTTVVQNVLFTPSGPETSKNFRWQVQDKTGTRSIVVSEDFVAFQTTAYVDFDDFISQVALAVDTTADAVSGLYLGRIGLRYVNHIRPKSGESWTQYVRPELHGPHSPLFRKNTQSHFHQSTAQTKHGTLIVRLYQNREGQLLPPDLVEDGLKGPVTPTPSEQLTLLDLDHFSVADEDYAKGQVEKRTSALHDDIEQIFLELVTDHAVDVWK